jgi:hypothetical protein
VARGRQRVGQDIHVIERGGAESGRVVRRYRQPGADRSIIVTLLNSFIGLNHTACADDEVVQR